jgi:ectoine hydroxylase-related dioxygenase (phytanoyl-CoA dioxygenase family)
MQPSDVKQAWRADGFAIVPGYLPVDDLAPALDELSLCFPTATGFHEGSDPRRQRFLDDEFNGIDFFPFGSLQLSLLAVHARIVDLVEALLGTDDVRIYSAESWAKYTGAADYDQWLHRDFLLHTLLVPTGPTEFQQVEIFVYLVDVPDDLGPPHFVPRTHTAGLLPLPNWHPPADTDPGDDRFVATAGRPDLYAAEVSAAGPAGTVVVFTPDTLHRGTALTRPGGARYSMHLSFRVTNAEWAQRQGWPNRSHDPAWYQFVEQATPRQLALFGFPPPGHPFWTAEALAGTALRYPRLDLTPWEGSGL